MRTQATCALLALLVAVAPAEGGLAKRLTKSAGRVAGKAIVHAKEAEKASEEAVPGGVTETHEPNAVAGVTAIVPGEKAESDAGVKGATAVAPAGEASAAKLEGTVSSEDTAPTWTVDAFGDSVEALPSSLRENSYFYSSFGTQDPFRSLLAGDFTPKLQELVDVHTVQMVGVIWEPNEVAAMVQDAQGFGYTLRPGDAVKNGSVVAVRQDALVARLNIFGQTTQVTLRLQRDEE